MYLQPDCPREREICLYVNILASRDYFQKFFFQLSCTGLFIEKQTNVAIFMISCCFKKIYWRSQKTICISDKNRMFSIEYLFWHAKISYIFSMCAFDTSQICVKLRNDACFILEVGLTAYFTMHFLGKKSSYISW